VQHLTFQETDPPPFYRPNVSRDAYVGQPKGMRQVLFERGLYVEGMTENGPKDGSNVQLGMKYVLSECLDFKNQKCQLEVCIESRGHICDFFPKYHPELSALERVWGMAKRFLRKTCKYNYENLVKRVPEVLVSTSLSSIRRFFRKCRDYQNAYRLGLSGPDVGAQIKIYKSHRMPPPHESNEDLVKHKPYSLKKKIVEQRKLQDMLQRLNALMLNADDDSNSETLTWHAEESGDHFGFGALLAELEQIADDDSYA